MTSPTSRENSTRALSTADLAATSRQSARVNPDTHETEEPEVERHERDRDSSSLEPLFTADHAENFRNRWAAIQSSFVDDPSGAVRAGDELVAQVMSELANTFAEQRHRVESRLETSGSADTEDLRVALTSYRSFFERLLSL
ncbi:MAG: hypothetical protein JSR66_02090 [Proteobacteria bacterium]|nr:hypothetical protein [Pseudomonadota bacterium]